MEVHDRGGRLAQITALLKRQGYKVVVEQDALLEMTELYNVYAIRPAEADNSSREAKKEAFAVARSVLSKHIVTISELSNFLQEKLPEYMIPSAFVVLRALPLTPNGKVDRGGLPAPDQVQPEWKKPFVAARTPVEEVLAGIWREVLGVNESGIHDNFFELGGDSILCIQIIARAQQAGLWLTPKQLFQHQTIAELAAVANTAPLIQADQGLVTGPLPLTPIQQWFFENHRPELHLFHQTLLLEMRTAVAPQALRKSVQHLLLHHDALRLRFVQNETGWHQLMAGIDEEVPFACEDLSRLPVAEHGAVIAATAATLHSRHASVEGATGAGGAARPGP